MKLYLFGGYETKLNQFERMYEIVGEQLKFLNPDKVLHIPFADTKIGYRNRHHQVKEFLVGKCNTEFEFINAATVKSITNSEFDTILISGGSSNVQLIEEINQRANLLKIIKMSKHLFGESAGGMILGTNLWEGKNLIKGYNILPDTIFEPHFSERNRQARVMKAMRLKNLKYGISLDCCTGIIFDRDQFPGKYKKVGDGIVTIITQ